MYLFKNCYTDDKCNHKIFKSRYKAYKAYKGTIKSDRIYPLYFNQDYVRAKNKIKDNKYKYYWIATTSINLYKKPINIYNHKNKKYKQKIMWFLFPPKKKGTLWETRVIKCI